MAPTRFSIVLDNPVGAYFPGQTITGKVILVLDQEKNSQGLKLKLNGEAEVKWQEGIQAQTGAKGFHEKESYFHTKIVLLGDGKINTLYVCDLHKKVENIFGWFFYKIPCDDDIIPERGSTDISIPAGHHEYPFSFELPLSLPSSFESQFGNVRYDIEAVVKRSWKFDYSTKIMFTVNALVDLNPRTALAEPKEATKEKSICCLCCKEGPISMRIQVPRTGYVPGDVIKFSVSSENSSSRPIAAIAVYFIREIYYRAQGRTEGIQKEIVKKRGPEVQPFLSESWAEEIHIPAIPPSDLGGCKIIEIVYMLKFKLDIPSSIDLKKKIPLVIGTIPFTNFLPDLQESIPATTTGGPETEPSAPPLPLPQMLAQYPNMPAPVYQDAVVLGKENEDKKDGSSSSPPRSGVETPVPDESEQRFVPKYATYNYGWKFQLNVPDQNGLSE